MVTPLKATWNLRELDLQLNIIDNLEPTLFSGLTKLKNLHLDDNQIAYNNGKRVSHFEFKRLLSSLINNEISNEPPIGHRAVVVPIYE